MDKERNDPKKNTDNTPKPKMKINAKLNRPIHTVISDMKREVAFGGEVSRSAIRGDNCIIVFNWIKPHEDNAPFHDHPFDQTD